MLCEESASILFCSACSPMAVGAASRGADLLPAPQVRVSSPLPGSCAGSAQEPEEEPGAARLRPALRLG